MDSGSRHRTRFLARLVLAWFLVALGVAVAAPVVNPQTMQLVCSGSATIKLLVHSDEGSEKLARPTLDCPMCVTVTPPPTLAGAAADLPSGTVHVLHPIVAARIASRTAAPLPARGPPAFS